MDTVIKIFAVSVGRECDICVTKQMLKQALCNECGHPVKDFEVYDLKDVVSLTTFVQAGEDARKTLTEKAIGEIEFLRDCNETH